MFLLPVGAAATALMFATDALFAFASWRCPVAARAATSTRFRKLHGFVLKREPLLAVVALLACAALLARAGVSIPSAACLGAGAVIALVGHQVIYVKTGCLMRGFEASPVGSDAWRAAGGKLEIASVARASLLAAALICLVSAGLLL